MARNLDYNKIKKFYEESEEIWPVHNNWYNYTKKKINYFINKYIFDGYILNAGSGGNTYGLNIRMCHVDVVKKTYVSMMIMRLPVLKNCHLRNWFLIL